MSNLANSRRHHTSKLILSLVICISSFLALACQQFWEDTRKEPDVVSVSRFDPIFMKDINLATSMADIADLREISLIGDDIEVRIWRSYSLPTLEGVFLKRTAGEWSGLHLRVKGDDHVQTTEVKQLNTPEIGWDLFWAKIAEKGILLLPITAENECDIRYIDGILYVVEISQNKMYRNYQYQQGTDCRESKQMTEIGEIIGVAFDSGSEECKKYEWFSCMTKRKAQSPSAQ